MPMSDYLRQLRAHVGSSLILVPCVTALVFDEHRRLLLVRHAQEDVWGLVGGAIEPDESPEDAVVREAWEETGLHVRPTGLRAVLGGPQFRVTYPNGDEVGYVAAVFDCQQIGGTLRPDGQEVIEAKFFDCSKWPTLSAYAQALAPIITATNVPTLGPVKWNPPALPTA